MLAMSFPFRISGARNIKESSHCPALQFRPIHVSQKTFPFPCESWLIHSIPDPYKKDPKLSK